MTYITERDGYCSVVVLSTLSAKQVEDLQQGSELQTDTFPVGVHVPTAPFITIGLAMRRREGRNGEGKGEQKGERKGIRKGRGKEEEKQCGGCWSP